MGTDLVAFKEAALRKYRREVRTATTGVSGMTTEKAQAMDMDTTAEWAEWRTLSLAQALEYGRTREIVRSEEVHIDELEGEAVHFSDGSVLQLLHSDGRAWSDYTWEDGMTIIRVKDGD